MRVLLLGSQGMLAHDLLGEAPDEVEVLAPPETELDITQETVVRSALTDLKPNVVINAAAYTNVDKAESEPEQAFLINAEAVGIVGRVAATLGDTQPLVVHYSTDYIFGGSSDRAYREDDETDPLGVYGRSKLAGETELVVSGCWHMILRTQWLFGIHGKSFPRTMWERARGGQQARVVSDQTGRPTYTVDLARATWRLVAGDYDMPKQPASQRTSTVFHVSNSGTTTWYDVARRVYVAAGAADLLTACATDDYPTPARRPAWSVLDTSKYERAVGEALPSWQDAIDRFLAGVEGKRAWTQSRPG